MKILTPYALIIFYLNIFSHHETVTEWYRSSRSRHPLVTEDPIVSFSLFSSYLEKFIVSQKEFLDNANWIDNKIPLNDLRLKNSNFMRPCTLKLTAPENAQFFIWGDLHGDIRSLSTCLYKLYQDNMINDHFKILQPDSYFLFLGDMVDRGQHGPDVLTLLFMFATNNPGRVFLLRGNHEDLDLNKQPYYHNDKKLYHFYHQLHAFNKGDDFESLIKMVALFYNLLPVAAFIGCSDNYIQCCHGGLELRYDPKNLLNSPGSISLEALKNLSMPTCWTEENYNNWSIVRNHFKSNRFTDIELDKMTPFDLGFLWNDFNANPSDPFISYCEPNRGIIIGKTLAKNILSLYSGKKKVKGIIRAHQHNKTMPGILNAANTGIYSLWNNLVITTVATDIFNTPTAFLKLELNNDFKKWQITNFYNTFCAAEIPSWNTRFDFLFDWKNKQN